MNDCTIIFYTSNLVPDKVMKKVQEQLLKTGLPIISVSQKPMDFGENICVGDIGQSYINIYKQMLIGAKAAKTKYIAFAEDDVIYSKEHFNFEPTCFAYDMNKWSVYTWAPYFHIKNRRTNTDLICPRDMFIEAMEERFKKYPDDQPLSIWAEPGRYEKELGVKVQPVQEYVAEDTHIVFSHEKAVGYGIMGNRKRMGFQRATEVMFEGKPLRIEEAQEWFQ
jgi:hypothetical protein